MNKVLITGGCGFVGHHFVEHFLKYTDWDIYIIDKLSYSSFGFDRLRDIKVFDDSRVHIFAHDFVRPMGEGMVDELGVDFKYILHLGAESHVDNSIVDPKPFVMSNVVGTMEMLQFARKQKELQAFVYFSTDEVFGPANKTTPGTQHYVKDTDVKFKEWDRYNSTNPYSAAKAGGEELALAFSNTYKIPLLITHTMNVFGERQHPEKYIPMCVKKILAGEEITIHSNAEKTKAGSRFYIHARDVADAVLYLLNGTDNKVSGLTIAPNGVLRDKVNVCGLQEVDNLELAQAIGYILNKEVKYKMVDFHSSRPGHDLRYALDGAKLQLLGYKYEKTFIERLEKSIKWMVKEEHKRWL